LIVDQILSPEKTTGEFKPNEAALK